jgi:hypothetical protein
MKTKAGTITAGTITAGMMKMTPGMEIPMMKLERLGQEDEISKINNQTSI